MPWYVIVVYESDFLEYSRQTGWEDARVAGVERWRIFWRILSGTRSEWSERSCTEIFAAVPRTYCVIIERLTPVWCVLEVRAVIIYIHNFIYCFSSFWITCWIQWVGSVVIPLVCFRKHTIHIQCSTISVSYGNRLILVFIITFH